MRFIFEGLKPDKFVERIIAFVDKVDFANKTLNQAGKQRRYLSKKNKEDQED
jgi:hypothetical protein